MAHKCQVAIAFQTSFLPLTYNMQASTNYYRTLAALFSTTTVYTGYVLMFISLVNRQMYVRRERGVSTNRANKGVLARWLALEIMHLFDWFDIYLFC